MRVIWYFIDALSPSVVNTFNSPQPVTYLDELAKNALKLTNAYGYGYTQPTVTSMFTGTDHSENPGIESKAVENPFRRIFDQTVTSEFKKNGFQTIYYANLNLKAVDCPRKHRWNPRYFQTLYRDFDVISRGAERPDQTVEQHLGAAQAARLFSPDTKQNQFILYYDFSLHDDPRSYKGATIESYRAAAQDSIGNMKANLEFLKYDPAKDYLVFTSDHGLTLAPYSDVYFDSKVSPEFYEKNWSTIVSEFRMQHCFFVTGPGIKPQTVSTPVHAKEVFKFVKALAQPRPAEEVAKIPGMLSVSGACFSTMAPVYGSPYDKFTQFWVHPYWVFRRGVEKWVYRHGDSNGGYYHTRLGLDLPTETLTPVSEADVPAQFKEQILGYFSASNQAKLYAKMRCAETIAFSRQSSKRIAKALRNTFTLITR